MLYILNIEYSHTHCVLCLGLRVTDARGMLPNNRNWLIRCQQPPWWFTMRSKCSSISSIFAPYSPSKSWGGRQVSQVQQGGMFRRRQQGLDLCHYWLLACGRQSYIVNLGFSFAGRSHRHPCDGTHKSHVILPRKHCTVVQEKFAALNYKIAKKWAECCCCCCC